MYKKTVDWLMKASGLVKSKTLITSNGGVVSDGSRLHMVNGEKLPLDDIDGINIEEVCSNMFSEDILQSQFIVNPKFLREALSGFEANVTVKFYNDPGNQDFQGLYIAQQSNDDDKEQKEAFIMCIKENEDE